MRAEELRKKSTEDLEKALNDARSKAVDLRFGVAAGNTKGIGDLRRIRREIAQVMTILREGKNGNRTAEK
ncbi:MAG: 50S ribosomal protein L29 [Candidatus Spechtbacteria bacterium RIFCSPLOWO2_01_FULL_46_10]|uniref:Large ribosomal subunit protein uL29 n=1 Tax=Candidatus Spechtbacteria bacterium RIFCSPLOWO2_01_FULL_46_10 TaxID=1802163 RepID=A0A1G2HFS8_9BACT|nr:MAG: 50S ribosomal protein L29 [Candidatus Spechtbacteria bacterium RIFCSPLOWO2_01_FULL_46_10]